MVMSSTRAVAASIHAVFPESILGAAGAAGVAAVPPASVVVASVLDSGGGALLSLLAGVVKVLLDEVSAGASSEKATMGARSPPLNKSTASIFFTVSSPQAKGWQKQNAKGGVGRDAIPSCQTC